MKHVTIGLISSCVGQGACLIVHIDPTKQEVRLHLHTRSSHHYFSTMQKDTNEVQIGPATGISEYKMPRHNNKDLNSQQTFGSY